VINCPGPRENNLKNISLLIPKRQIIVFTGQVIFEGTPWDLLRYGWHTAQFLRGDVGDTP
jgi:hypothetical protein